MKTEEEIIKRLNNMIINAKYDYLQHKKLFFNDDQNLHMKIIEATTPDFFHHLNELLWDRMILSISKLTDKYDEGKNMNLSINYLAFISERNEMKCASKIKPFYQELLDHVKGVRKYRSKVVAHKDFSTSFYSKLSIQIDEIEKAFLVIELMMNLYHLEKSEMTWLFDLEGTKDVGSLFYFLEQALIYETMTKTRNDYQLDFIEEQEWRKTLA